MRIDLADPRVMRRALWVVLAASIIIRLPHLAAPIEDRHSWNQCSTATVIRNLAERDFNPFRTQWDVLDPGPARDNVEAEEAPIYHVAAAAAYRAFGASHAWPRLLSIVAMLTGSIFLFRLTTRLFDEQTGVAAVFFWNFAPYPWFFGRTIMSDPWMVACVIAAADLWHRRLESDRPRDLYLAGLATCLAGLFKVFALYLGVLFLVTGLARHRARFFTSARTWIFAALCAFLPVAWIVYAAGIGSLGNATEGAGQIVGSTKLWGSAELLTSGKFWMTLQSRLLDRAMTPVVTALAVVALISRDTRARSRYVLWWLAATGVFALVMGEGHFLHNYYQLPFTPPLAVLAGAGFVTFLRRFDSPDRRLAVGLAAIAVFLSVSTLYVRNEYRTDPSSTRAGELARTVIPDNALLLVLDPGSTRKNQVIYHAHRRGWFSRRLSPDDIERHRAWGATFAVTCLSDDQLERAKDALGYLDDRYRIVRTGRAFGDGREHRIRIYDLRSAKP
ncbi:MAG: glycosyltransferase family 39 protein [Deltaproteobacteria bacterium]|nr:glycosyltransferase family 39 protein [Deltaproteobacteria bacterium]